MGSDRAGDGGRAGVGVGGGDRGIECSRTGGDGASDSSWCVCLVFLSSFWLSILPEVSWDSWEGGDGGDGGNLITYIILLGLSISFKNKKNEVSFNFLTLSGIS